MTLFHWRLSTFLSPQGVLSHASQEKHWTSENKLYALIVQDRLLHKEAGLTQMKRGKL